MPILNYTTSIEAIKTVSEIEAILVKAKAKEITKGYDTNGEPVSLVFELGEAVYILLCRWKAVFKLLGQTKGVEPRYRTPAQARRVAWRNVKTWIMAQLAFIETGQADLEEVMFPYRLDVDSGQSVYELYVERDPNKLLEQRK